VVQVGQSACGGGSGPGRTGAERRGVVIDRFLRSWIEFLADRRSARERGILDAHRICAGPNSWVENRLRNARRGRRRPLAWFSPWWRSYLGVVIEKLEAELAERKREA
jgi:hypothetical protein